MEKAKRPPILLAFGRALRARRIERGLSQEALAAAAKLDRTYVGGVERGERNVALVNIGRLAAALGTTPAELLAEMEIA
jgi:transcriptional regulator with XRE-family HTH domain